MLYAKIKTRILKPILFAVFEYFKARHITTYVPNLFVYLELQDVRSYVANNIHTMYTDYSHEIQAHNSF